MFSVIPQQFHTYFLCTDLFSVLYRNRLKIYCWTFLRRVNDKTHIHIRTHTLAYSVSCFHETSNLCQMYIFCTCVEQSVFFLYLNSCCYLPFDKILNEDFRWDILFLIYIKKNHMPRKNIVHNYLILFNFE